MLNNIKLYYSVETKGLRIKAIDTDLKGGAKLLYDHTLATYSRLLTPALAPIVVPSVCTANTKKTAGLPVRIPKACYF